MKTKSIKLSVFYNVMRDMYCSDLQDYMAIEAASIARMLEQNYSIKDGQFYLESDTEISLYNILSIFRYVFHARVQENEYSFSPISMGASMASVLDNYEVSYRYTVMSEDEITINIF